MKFPRALVETGVLVGLAVSALPSSQSLPSYRIGSRVAESASLHSKGHPSETVSNSIVTSPGSGTNRQFISSPTGEICAIETTFSSPGIIGGRITFVENIERAVGQCAPLLEPTLPGENVRDESFIGRVRERFSVFLFDHGDIIAANWIKSEDPEPLGPATDKVIPFRTRPQAVSGVCSNLQPEAFPFRGQRCSDIPTGSIIFTPDGATVEIDGDASIEQIRIRVKPTLPRS